ncbi:MAG: carbohydrate kinase family protein [Clostridiales bacterium]|nr:carbohydrate kinase family protein [Clostridiales bacterium]
MKLFVSGLINVETNLRVRSFPVTYYPIDYPFFGINTTISGVGYNVSMAAKTLGDEVVFSSLIGKDHEGKRISHKLDGSGVARDYVFECLDATPVSVILYEQGGRRQIYCDLKDIQDKSLEVDKVKDAVLAADVCILCNSNFNRVLLPIAKQAGKQIATDVHVLNDIYDPFNRDFMENADILFLSDEDIPCSPRDFLIRLKDAYQAKIIVIGLGEEGAIMYERATDGITRVSAVNLGGVVNTVGAGDALFTAFNHYYFKGCGAVESLKKAEVFAALKIRHDGGAVGFSTEQEVEDIYNSYGFQVN